MIQKKKTKSTFTYNVTLKTDLVFLMMEQQTYRQRAHFGNRVSTVPVFESQNVRLALTDFHPQDGI